MRTACAAIVVFAAALAAASGPPAGAADEAARARSEFEAIVQTASWGAVELRGPSLTSLFRSLLSHEPALVRQVEEEAWRAAQRPGTAAYRKGARIEDAISFVHGLPPRRDLEVTDRFLTVGGGAVVRRVVAIRWANNFLPRLAAPFEEWVGAHPPRPPPSPRADCLFLLLASPTPKEASETEKWEVAPALGEICATDDAAFAEVLRRATAAPDDGILQVALGWSRRPAAAEFLAARVQPLVGSPSADVRDLRLSVSALAYADPEAAERLVAGLPERRADLVLSLLDRNRLVGRRFAAVEAASDAGARRAALERLCSSDPCLADLPCGPDAARLLGVILANVDSDDAALREAALRAGEQLLHGPGTDILNGERFPRGSFAGTEAALRLLLSDLAEGRIEIRDQPGIFESCPEEIGGPWIPARTDARPESPLPLHLSGRWEGDGLRLTFRNDGDRPLAIDTVNLRHGTATWPVSVEDTRHVPREAKRARLTLTFGDPTTPTVVPARFVTILAPGEVREVLVPMRPDLRAAGHVSVAFPGPAPAVVGPLDAPLVRFGETVLF